MSTERILAVICSNLGFLLIISGIYLIYTYLSSSCHGEGVDFTHYFLPGLIQIILGILAIIGFVIFYIRGGAL